MASAPHTAAFVADAIAWSRDDREALVLRLLRSPFSGVPHDIGAAYAVVAKRYGGLLGAIARERLALPPDDRDAMLSFAKKVSQLRAASDSDQDDSAIAALAERLFELDRFAPRPPVGTPIGEPALREPADAEAATGMRARQHHFSASSLNAYVECPRKWYYRYMCGAVEDKGSSASFYGTAFHLALEDFHDEFPRPSPADENRMRERLVACVDAAFARHRNDFETKVEFKLQLRRAHRTSRRYVSWLVERARRAPFTVIGRELPAALQVEGFDFIGFIDRLDRNDATGTVSVIDYKTGSIATSAAEYRDKVREYRDFQLPFYYWAREAQGDRVSTLALLPLKDAAIDVRPIELEVVPIARDERRRDDSPYGAIAVADLERARVKMGEICRDLTGGAISRFPVTGDPSACTYCAYQLACNDRPAPEEEKFGR
jgi:RecB family exonuclease